MNTIKQINCIANRRNFKQNSKVYKLQFIAHRE